MSQKSINIQKINISAGSADGSLSFQERLAYGCGDFANNIVFSGISIFLVYYYTDVIKIDAGLIGTIMLVSRIVDGILDLLMGVVVDRTRSKYGKARCWILRMAIPYAISGIILFSVPVDISYTLKIIYIIISYNFSQLIFTALLIPYATLGALITQNQYERGVLGIFRMLLATLGTIFINTFTLKMVDYFGGDDKAWTLTFTVFGLLSLLLLLFTFWGTEERVSDSNNETVPIKTGIMSLFNNKYWCIVAISILLLYFLLTVGGASTIYYAKAIFHDANLVVQLGNSVTISQVITMLVTATFIKKYGKRNVFVFGLVANIIGYLFLAFWYDNYYMAISSNILKGIGCGALASCMFGMLADTIEYGEWKTGVRVAGLVNSASSFGSKVGAGIGGAVVGWALSMGGYKAELDSQPASSIMAINSLYIYIPLIVSIIVLIMMFFYKLDQEYPEIIEVLKRRNNTGEDK
ncbi:MFS transporter [Brenneria roseae subsp. roseae]|uniref:MFS transporter n=1 Tax=Brenneria roseae TaxID=1509241 RepID=UPI000D60C91A|nr:MFS transporter [Brenneria roseae]PWC14618.1 MFS transporter [Brenneria roseae subsp. roseae]